MSGNRSLTGARIETNHSPARRGRHYRSLTGARIETPSAKSYTKANNRSLTGARIEALWHAQA